MSQQKFLGKFITLEGGEGVGKTTNLAFIQSYLAQQNINLVLTREPGGTPLGESVRDLLLDTQYKGMGSDTELLLVFAARAEHLNKVIYPALERGDWVLSDRFTDASFAYQGRGREMGFELINQLEAIVQKSFQPDLTLLLDADVELSQHRLSERLKTDRFEQEKQDFFIRVREGYLERAEASQGRINIIDATQSLEAVQADIVIVLDRLLSSE